MLQTFAVYITLSVVMLYLSYVGRAKQQWKYMVYAILVYSVVFGIRYGVGVDYFSYLHNYNAYTTTSGHWGVSQNFEPGFGLLTGFLASINAHYTVYFGIIAFLQLFFTFLALKGEYRLYPYLVFSFMIGTYWLSYSNCLRHILAMGLWIWAIKFIPEKKIWQYYLAIAVSCTMHTSAMVLIVFYPIFLWKQEWFRNRYVQLSLLAGAVVLMTMNPVQNLIKHMDALIALAGYEVYLDNDHTSQLNGEATLGLGFLVSLTINILLIVFSNKTKDYFKSKYLNMAYDLFIIGIVLKYIFINSMLFLRASYYFIYMIIIVVAFTMYYARQRNKALLYTLAILFGILFFGTLCNSPDNTASYIFFWQKDMFYLKF